MLTLLEDIEEEGEEEKRKKEKKEEKEERKKRKEKNRERAAAEPEDIRPVLISQAAWRLFPQPPPPAKPPSLRVAPLANQSRSQSQRRSRSQIRAPRGER